MCFHPSFYLEDEHWVQINEAMEKVHPEEWKANLELFIRDGLINLSSAEELVMKFQGVCQFLVNVLDVNAEIEVEI